MTLNLGGHQGVALRLTSAILYGCVMLAGDPVVVPWVCAHDIVCQCAPVTLSNDDTTCLVCLCLQHFLALFPDRHATLGTEWGPWQPVTPSLVLRPSLGGIAGVGAAGTVPTATTAPLPAPPQGFSSTEYPGNPSLFVLCGRQRPPPPQPAQCLPGAPSSPQQQGLA